MCEGSPAIDIRRRDDPHRHALSRPRGRLVPARGMTTPVTLRTPRGPALTVTASSVPQVPAIVAEGPAAHRLSRSFTKLQRARPGITL